MSRALAYLALAAVVVCGYATALSSPDSATYRAAAVMHTPVDLVRTTTIFDLIMLNLDIYKTRVINASTEHADIIVFPESGTGYLQVPASYVPLMSEVSSAIGWKQTNCTDDLYRKNLTGQPHQVFASCAAQLYGMDILINYCELDPTSGKRYNTNAGFHADGTLQAKYRKSHIAGTGPTLSQPSKPDAAVFTSSFNVRFGMFTCYDFWFAQPMFEEMQKMNVTDFLFPNELSSPVPYYYMNAAQAGWSLAYGVNLVASTSFGTGGAGVYHRGTAVALVQSEPANMSNAHRFTVGTLRKITRTQLPPGASLLGSLASRLEKSKTTSSSSLPQMQKSLRVHSSESMTSSSATDVVTLHSNDTCIYGPKWLNFTIGCTRFQPQPNKKYVLSATYSEAVTKVTCYGWLNVGSNTSATDSNATWILAAISLSQSANVGTPSSTTQSWCLFLRCATPDTGCMTMEPSAGWLTELSVTKAAVITELSGFAKKHEDRNVVYPIYGFEQPLTKAAMKVPNNFMPYIPPSSAVRFISDASDPSTLLYGLGTHDDAATLLSNHSLHGFGIVTSLLYETLNTTMTKRA